MQTHVLSFYQKYMNAFAAEHCSRLLLSLCPLYQETCLLITSSMKVIYLVSEDELRSGVRCTLCFYVTSPSSKKKSLLWSVNSFRFILFTLNAFSLAFRNSSFGYLRPSESKLLKCFHLFISQQEAIIRILNYKINLDEISYLLYMRSCAVLLILSSVCRM